MYTLYADHDDGSGRLLVCAKKLLKSRESHYVLSTNMDDLHRRRGDRSRHYLGKLRANSSLSEYVLYDSGVTPEEAGIDTTEGASDEGGAEDLTQEQRENLRKVRSRITIKSARLNTRPNLARRVSIHLTCCL